MARDAYIAREATSASPITRDQWLAVLATLPSQDVVIAAAPADLRHTALEQAAATAQQSAPESMPESTLQAAPQSALRHALTLPSGATTMLSLTPAGMVRVGDPDKDVMALLFTLAAALEARVYSERLRPYHSVRDWERRTGRTPSRPPQPRRRRSGSFTGRLGIRLTRRHAVAAALGLSILAMSLVLGLRIGD